MITWMQKHKKWLIVTIWISTIAFVGAGFVGWGSYDYGKSDSAVAVVGNKEVPMKDLQAEYSNLYSQYQQMLGENFNQEMAQQFKLEEAALQRVVQKYLLLNYADELGIITTDLEVAQELVKINSFFKDGKFDKNTYISVLKQNRRTATEFEELLKQDLLVRKIQKIFDVTMSKNEIKNLGSILFSEDKVSVKVITDTNIKVTPTQKELQGYWEKNKDDYKSPTGYNVSYSKIDNIDGKTKKEMKTVALKARLDLKKEKEKFDMTETIYPNSELLSQETFKTLISSKEDEILKPIYNNGSYIIVKLNKKVLPQTLPFEEVKSTVNKAYISVKKQEILTQMAEESIKNFNGKSIGYINRAASPTIDGLSDDEVSQLIQNIFISDKKINTLALENKIVVYEIEDTRLASYDQKNDDIVIQSIQSAKTGLIFSQLLENLKNKYTVTSYLQSK